MDDQVQRMKRTIGSKILRGAAIVSLLGLLTKAIGFIQKVVMAHYFGIGMEADAYTLAFSSIVFTFCIIPYKLLAPYLPLFAEQREKKGENGAWQFASSVMTLAAVIMGVAVILGIVCTPYLISAASSFESKETFNIAVGLTRIMLPAAFFMGLFYLAVLTMNAYKRFALPALGETLNKVLIITMMVVFYRAFGINGLAVGVVAGSLSCLLLQIFGLRREVHHVRPVVNLRDPMLRKLGKLVPPILVGILIAQARTILDFRFASGMGEGYTSSLGYAKAITDTLTMVGPFAVGVVIYPFFSDLSAEGDNEKITDTLMGALRMMAFIFIPLSIGLILLRTPVIQLAFQRGKFDVSSVDLTVGPLFYYAMGLTAFALEIILMRFYFSMKDTLTPVLVGIACVVLHVAVVLTLKGLMQHRSLALAAAASKSVKVVLLYFLLRFKIPDLRLRRNAVFMVKVVLAAAVMAIAVYWLNARMSTVLSAPADAGTLVKTGYLAGRLGICGLAGGLVFGAGALALRIEEAGIIWAFLRRREKHDGQD